MSNLEIINAQGIGYITEDFIPFRPSSCDKNGSMSFKVKANGHFKKKVPLSVRGSDPGVTYLVEIQGGTINGGTEFRKEYPINITGNETSRSDFAFVDNIELEIEFTNEATISIEQTLPTNVYSAEGNGSWTLTPITCNPCTGHDSESTIKVHSWMNLFNRDFQIEAVTCGAHTGI